MRRLISVKPKAAVERERRLVGLGDLEQHALGALAAAQPGRLDQPRPSPLRRYARGDHHPVRSATLAGRWKAAIAPPPLVDRGRPGADGARR